MQFTTLTLQEYKKLIKQELWPNATDTDVEEFLTNDGEDEIDLF